MRESHIEQRVCQTAKLYGWWPLKLNIIGAIGFPDRLLLRNGGRLIFIEFKAPGKKPRKAQQFILDKLKGLGFRVFVIDDIDEGEALVIKEAGRA